MGFTENQKKAINYNKGAIKIEAPAGSGKTTTMTEKIRNLIVNENYNPKKILAITFTKKASKEMYDKIYHSLNENGIEGLPTIGTFHSIFLRNILKPNKDKLGYSSLNVATESHRDYVAKEIALKYGYDNGSDLLDDVKYFKLYYFPNYILQSKSRFTTVGWYDEKTGNKNYNQKLIPFEKDDFSNKLPAVNHYISRLRSNNYIDFDDFLLETVRLFINNPDVLNKYQNIWDYVLVDEYQDTNILQRIFLQLLVRKHNNICVVGDGHQSIYKFRGGYIGNFVDFESHFPNAKKVHLQESFRCQPKIVDVANRLTEHSNEYDNEGTISMKKEGNDISVRCADGPYEESQYIAKKIKQLFKRGYKPKDIAILYRKNMQSRVVEREMFYNRIPYNIIGSAFEERKEIKDILSVLMFLNNKKDIVSFDRMLNFLGKGLGNGFINEIKDLVFEEEIEEEKKKTKKIEQTGLFGNDFENHKGESKNINDIIEAVESIKHSTKGTSKKYNNIDEFLKKFKNIESKLTKNNLYELIDYIFDVYYKKYLHKQCNRQNEYNERIENINVLKSVANDYYGEAISVLPDFLDEVIIDKNNESEEETETDNKVQLMTIHKSKGLEFSVVFIIGANQEIIPGEEEIIEENTPGIEEERRIFYVAMTRAKDILYISYLDWDYSKRDISYMTGSQFLEEAGLK